MSVMLYLFNHKLRAIEIFFLLDSFFFRTLKWGNYRFPFLIDQFWRSKIPSLWTFFFPILLSSFSSIITFDSSHLKILFLRSLFIVKNVVYMVKLRNCYFKEKYKIKNLHWLCTCFHWSILNNLFHSVIFICFN